jgi:hypothetical protein
MGDQGARSGDLAVGRPRRSPTRESEKKKKKGRKREEREQRK